MTRPDDKRPSLKSRPPSSRAPSLQEDDEPVEGQRIAKAMARAGLCSRRDAERWIASGRVAVNGTVLTTPAVIVGAKDRVEVDGQPLRKAEPARLWRYHKPRGRVTTHKDPEGRPTVFEALPEDMPRVVSIGRLDFNTEGLLLMTTNGALARHLELPSTGWLRRYRVRAHGTVKPEDLAELRDGIEIDGVHYGPIEAALDRQQGSNVWLTLGLREGKNREVRKILASLNLDVTRLIRLSFGPFALGDLEPGAVDEVQPRQIAEQVGGKVAEDLGLRYAAVVGTRPNRDAPADPTASGPARSASQKSPTKSAKTDPHAPDLHKEAVGLAHGRRAHHPGAKAGKRPASARDGKPPGTKPRDYKRK